MEIPCLPEALAEYLALCLVTADRGSEQQGEAPPQSLVSGHTTEFYALRTAWRR
jgi:hypothetical protein